MKKRKTDNQSEKKINIRTVIGEMPVALVLLISCIGVLIYTALCKPETVEDACSYITMSLAENAQLFGRDSMEGDVESAVDIAVEDLSETVEAQTEESVTTDEQTETEDRTVQESEADEEITEDTEESAEEETEENIYIIPTVSYDEYTPTQVDSRYFEDVGRIPHSMNAEYYEADDDYFADSCWIGDSRTLGIADYCGWEDADFYCDNGYCAYDYYLGKAVHLQGKGVKRTLDEAMDIRQYGKIYIMIGINDTGYATTDIFKENYQSMLDMIYEKQPDAILYLIGNMHISETADLKAKNGALCNLNINAKNVAISECADGIRSFYLDFNEFFTDDAGFLIDSMTFDGYHLYADGYMQLIQFFKEHTVVPPDEDMILRSADEVD